MRMFASSGQSYFEGMFFGDVTGLKAALKPLQDATGLVLQSATTKTWLDAFSHYANAATDPTTPYSFVRDPRYYNMKSHADATLATNILLQKLDAQGP